MKMSDNDEIEMVTKLTSNLEEQYNTITNLEEKPFAPRNRCPNCGKEVWYQDFGPPLNDRLMIHKHSNSVWCKTGEALADEDDSY